jgi:hypothetical protein
LVQQLTERLRRDVHVYEVESVAFGQVPRWLLGCWAPQRVVARLSDGTAPMLHDGSEDISPAD